MKTTLQIAGFIAALLALWVFVVGSTPNPERDARFAEQDRIADCWKGQERKSLDPGSARFVARVCEQMEDQYHTRWGRNP